MTQHAEPHHDPRYDDPRAEADDNWTPPELADQHEPGQHQPGQSPREQQPDPERADWMPPPEHRPPSLLGEEPALLSEDPGADQPVRHDPTATMLPPTDPTVPSVPPVPAGANAGLPGTSDAPLGGRRSQTSLTGATTTVDPLWPDAEVARFEGRWREVQLGFVDDPRHAADEARSLLDEVMDRLTQAIGDRRRELDTWRDGNGNGGDDTESMLGAVRRYRRLMDQLLAVGRPH